MGHVVSKEGISVNPNKIQAVKDWPIPRTVKEIKIFIGLVGYYRRFVQDFSKIAAPLTKLTRKGERYSMVRGIYYSIRTIKGKTDFSSNLEDSLRNRRDGYI